MSQSTRTRRPTTAHKHDARVSLFVGQGWAGTVARDLLDAMVAAGFRQTMMGGNVLAFVRRDGARETLVVRSDTDDIPRALRHPVEVFVQEQSNDVEPSRVYASARAFLASQRARPNPSRVEEVARRKGWAKVVTSYGGGHWVAAPREGRRGRVSAGTYWELWSPDCTRQWAFSDDRRSPRVKVYHFKRTRAGEIAGKMIDEFTVPAADLEDGTVWPVRHRSAARDNPSAQCAMFHRAAGR